MGVLYHKPGLTLTIPATGTVGAFRFATLAGALPATPANAIGVTQTDYVSGETMTLVIAGIVPVFAAGAITAGDYVEVVADGSVKKQAAGGGTACGRALNDSADGTLVSVLLAAPYHAALAA